MKRLSFDEYMSMTRDDRIALRRKAFGHPAPLPPHLYARFDLEHLRQNLIAQNDATGWFPGRWVDQLEEETE
jgi:hypothetical protein